LEDNQALEEAEGFREQMFLHLWMVKGDKWTGLMKVHQKTVSVKFSISY
jgi:hypothetical protein